MAGFRKKKCEQAFLKFGIYGTAGSGKSFTTLLCAEKLAAKMGKRIAYIDTEHGTDLYAVDVPQREAHPKAFDFDCLDTRSLTEANRECKRLDFDKYGVIAVDSITQFWDAAIAAYEGKKTSIGSIPMHAWGSIKRPYKELINFLLNAPAHVFILGREGNEFRRDEESDELEVVGKRMKSEGETPYEPPYLLQMIPLKKQNAPTIYRAYAEKDRSGVLAGQIIVNPCFENICLPLMGLLSGTQAQIPTADETAAQDAVAIAESEASRKAFSNQHREEFEARFKLAKDKKELDAVSKELTPAIKKAMTTHDVTALREAYRMREQQLSGEFRLEPDAA
jgi:hypothetical protein